jgi:hypothetical protein
MKKMIVCGFISTMLFLSSCVSFNIDKVKPSGNIVKEEYQMEPFNEVDLDLMGNVKIVQGKGDDYRVVISAPDNYIEFYKFSVDGHELNGDIMHSGALDTDDVKITIYTPELRSLENEGLATIIIDSLTTRSLSVENSGVGAMKLRNLSINKLAVECSGVGGITMSGQAAWVRLDCSGVGSIDARNLKARRVQGEVNGVGSINCHATDTLKATVNGVGSFKFAGNPGVKKLSDNGVGSISEL